MNLPKGVHRRLATEYRFAADKMAQETNIQRKLFFLSAFYGEASRTLNWAWDRDVVLIHSVIQNTHQQMNARLQSGDRGELLSEAIFRGLAEAADELTRYVEGNGKDLDLQTILGRFAELAYAVTGNGSWLIERGTLKI